ncbi:MAG: hypothetical protein HYV26_00690, partial [Candidatus Hydrogenedentes bacterium]|nr:hypothetical protein [Candidatus Hydrogenedentota bacterium]
MRWFVLSCALGVCPLVGAEEEFSPEAIDFFEREVRPVLVEHCLECHGPEKQKLGLRLDSREAMLKG